MSGPRRLRLVPFYRFSKNNAPKGQKNNHRRTKLVIVQTAIRKPRFRFPSVGGHGVEVESEHDELGAVSLHQAACTSLLFPAPLNRFSTWQNSRVLVFTKICEVVIFFANFPSFY